MSESTSPRSGPSPASLAAEAAARAAGPGDPARHPGVVAAAELLDEADMVRSSADDDLDLGALSRQAELLTKAHDHLAAALEDAGRG